MPTLLDELTLGIAVVDDYSLENQRRIYYSSSGQMELDEQPKGSITLLIKRKRPGFSIREQLKAEQKTALLNSLRRMKNLQGEETKVSPN
jgi:hypothetical protein